MRIVPILLLLVAGAAQSQEPTPNTAPVAGAAERDARVEQAKAKLAEFAAKIASAKIGIAAPFTGPNARIFQPNEAKPAAATGECAIPLLTAQPAPGVNFTMRQIKPDLDNMAPMPRIVTPVCESRAR